MPSRRVRQTVGLIGFPVKHSISPAFQQAAFDYHGVPARYTIWETPPADLPSTMARLREENCLGANVTVPHKEQVLAWLDEVDERAALVGAVNTIVNRSGKLLGYNTDIEGFVRALDDEGFVIEGKRVVLVGAGGVARAVAVALIEGGAKSISLINRHPERALALALDLRKLRRADQGTQIDVRQWGDVQLESADLVVNATSVGMRHGPAPGDSPVPPGAIPAGSLVFDLVYTPSVTRLLREAEAAGARGLNGLSMLVYQGAASFELWTGKPAPLGLMFERARRALLG